MTMPGRWPPQAGNGARPRTMVIGGTGFLGKHVCAEFSAAGHELLVVARDPARSKPGQRFVPLDLARDGAVEALVRLFAAERPDIVVNAAGAVWAPSENQMLDSNVDLVRHLVTAISGLPKPPRLIHLGSVNEYAPLAPGSAVREDTPLRPLTRYGESKAAGSAIVLDAMRQAGVTGLVLRLANVAGPGLPAVSLLGRVAVQLGRSADIGPRATVRLYAMRAQRDFLDYRDAAQAIRDAATAQISGRAVPIGSGVAVSVRSLVAELITVSGIAADVLEEEYGPAASPTEAEWLQVDPGPARDMLAWSPRRSLTDSLRDLWEHVRSGREWGGVP